MWGASGLIAAGGYLRCEQRNARAHKFTNQQHRFNFI